jgi:hypothetical protein
MAPLHHSSKNHACECLVHKKFGECRRIDLFFTQPGKWKGLRRNASRRSQLGRENKGERVHPQIVNYNIG